MTRDRKCPVKGFVYVWEAPIRISHWVNFFAILVLVFTGIYIHYPFMSPPFGQDTPYLMGQMRFVHYFTAMIFVASVLLRLWWGLVGNRHASYKSVYNPFNKEDRKHISAYIKYYLFIQNKPSHVLTHNPMAQYAYLGIFVLFILQIITGFALWSLNDPNGTLFGMFGWMLTTFDAQYVRMFHYLVVFFIGAFLIIHLYAAILLDFKTHDGGISSMFSGWKVDTNE